MLALLASWASPTLADDWPQWRGPRRDGVSREIGLLKSWPKEGPPAGWSAKGLGEGYASVVVSRGRVFTIGRIAAETFCFAIDESTGSLKWKTKIGETTRIPSSTPTVDDDRVFALDPDGDLVCLAAATGREIWRRQFIEDFGGRMQSGRGYGESPLIDGSRLICTPGGAEATMVALNKQTGDLIWRTQVPELGKAGGDGAGFSSIVRSNAAGVPQFVQLIGRGLVGLRADDGKFLWGYNALANRTANIPTPIARGDMVFAANGYNAGSVLLKLKSDGSGGVNAEEIYTLNGSRFQNHHGGVIRLGDHLYGGHGSNNGLPTCLELASGRLRWKRRGPGIGSAAITCADERLYFRYQNGVVAQIQDVGGDCWAHPVVANGRLLLREKDRLLTYDLRANRSTPRASTKKVELTGLPSSARVVAKRIRKFAAVQLLARVLENDRSAAAQFDRFIIADSSSPSAKQAVLVTLTNQHLTAKRRIQPELLLHLSSLTTPFVLDLSGTSISDEGLAPVAGLRYLKSLRLNLCGQITDASLKSLASSANLRVLQLTGTEITDLGLARLAKSKSLVALNLETCDRLTDKACTSIGKMKQLEALIIKKTGFEPQRFSDQGLQALSGLKCLKLLNLYGNRIKNDGLAHLAGMRELEELDLSLLWIDDQALKHVAKLPKLRRLSLLFSEGFAGPTITNAGVDNIGQLRQLRSLNLVGAKITDAGLPRLSSLKQLEELQLVNSKTTSAGVAKLRKSLPNCRILR